MELDQPYNHISSYKQLLQEILDDKIWQSVKIHQICQHFPKFYTIVT